MIYDHVIYIYLPGNNHISPALEKGTSSTQKCLGKGYVTLWQTNIAGWNITIFNRKYIFNPGPFSIAMLVYRSVNDLEFHDGLAINSSSETQISQSKIARARKKKQHQVNHFKCNAHLTNAKKHLRGGLLYRLTTYICNWSDTNSPVCVPLV